MGARRRLRLARGEEDRSEDRYPTDEMEVEFPISADVVDISETGMGIESMDPLRVGASYVFRVQLGEGDLGMPGRVEWCRLTGTRKSLGAEHAAVYRAGVSFVPGPALGSWGKELASRIEDGLEPATIEVQA